MLIRLNGVVRIHTGICKLYVYRYCLEHMLTVVSDIVVQAPAGVIVT